MVNKSFSSLDVYKLIEANPSLLSINSHFLRNAGLIESIKQDKKSLRQSFHSGTGMLGLFSKFPKEERP